MKRKLFILLFLITYISALYAQVRQGEVAIGQIGVQEGGTSIVQTNDGGYILTGTNAWADTINGGIYIVKLDSNLRLQWTKIVGGGGEVSCSIVQTKDSGYAVVGMTQSYGAGICNVYVVKLNSAGNLQWTRTIGGISHDIGNSLVQTNDGGYAITGVTNSFGDTINGDVYVVKLDSSGNLKWTKTIGGTGHDVGNSIVQADDGGYTVAGTTDSYGAGGDDVYVIKMDSSGNLKWTKTIGGTGYDVGNSIVKTDDGGYAVTGVTGSYGAGGDDVYVIKLDSSGNLKWTKTIGGEEYDVSYSIVQTKDRGYAITGGTNSFGLSNTYVYTIKLDSIGNMQWTKVVGGSYDDEGFGLVQTKDDGYAIVGNTAVDGVGVGQVYMAKLDSLGNICLTSITDSGRIGSGGTVSTGGIVNSGGSITAIDSGKVNSGGIETDICGVASVDNLISIKNHVQVYPNPNNGVFTVQSIKLNVNSMVEVYNMFGDEIYSEKLNSVNTQIDLSTNPSGIYLYRVLAESGGLISTGKLIIQK